MLVNKQELENAIKKIYASYEDIPSDFNLILKAENDQLSITLNEWHTLSITINLEVQEANNLSVAINLLQFLATVQNSKETISIKKIGNLLKVDQYFINCWQIKPSSDDRGKKIYQFTAKSLEIKKGIEYVNYARSGEETKTLLCGIGIHPCYIAATDGHRLAEYIYGDDRTIQARPIGFYKYQQLLDFLEQDQDVTITQYEHSAIIDCDGWIFHEHIYHKVDYKSFIGCYPTTDQLIPQYFDSKAIIDRIDLISAIERNTVCIEKEKHEIIRLNFDYNSLAVSSSSDQKYGEEKIEITSDSRVQKPILIAMNVAYLLQSLKNLESEQIVIKFDDNDGTKPVTIAEIDNDKKIALLMPVQLRS